MWWTWLACQSPKPPAPRLAKGDSLYFALVDRFADEAPNPPGSVDPDDPQAWHGGDIAGVSAHLGHLEALGMGGLWLSPVTRTRVEPIGKWGAYHGYWMLEPAEIEPRFGTVEQLTALSERLHRTDRALYLDIVLNHVGYDAPRTTSHPDWFHHLGDIDDYEDPVQRITHDVHGLPDLDQDHPEVHDWLVAGGRHWLETVQPDGFRIDAVRHLPEGYLARYRDDLGAPEDFQVLGEVFDGNPATLGRRMTSDALDAVFDFPLMYGIRESALCVDGDYDKLAANLFTHRHLPERDPGSLLPAVTLLDNHDTPRIASVCRHPQQALALLFGAWGTPSITWGTESWARGAGEPDNRSDMDWQGPQPASGLIQRLNDLRGRWKALRDGDLRIETRSDTALHFTRNTPESTVHIVHHTTPSALDLAVEEAWLVGDNVPRPWDGGPFRGVLLARTKPQAAQRPRPIRISTPDRPPEGTRFYAVGSSPELGGWTARGGALLEGPIAVPHPAGSAAAIKLVAVSEDAIQWSQTEDVVALAGETVVIRWVPEAR